MVDQDVIERLWAAVEAEPETEVTVDLKRAGSGGPIEVVFEVDDYIRWRLLEGLDDIGMTLQHADQIANLRAGRPGFLP